MMDVPIEWDSVRLVVFDVDGTLYDQSVMRRRMLFDLLGHTLAARSLATLRILRHYRSLREVLGEQEVDGFDDILVARTAADCAVDTSVVRNCVSEWIQQRPLAHILKCRYAHVADVFRALRSQGKLIGIFSDYPAGEKLDALDLRADFMVSAGDPGVGILKPHPRGLEVIIAAAGVRPGETLMIGDRVERDGEAARRAGVRPLIRSSRPITEWPCFPDFAAPPFRSLLDRSVTAA